MEIPDFLFATLSNLSLFTMSSRLRIKLQIGKEMAQNSAPDNRCDLNAKLTIRDTFAQALLWQLRLKNVRF
jgi:hypothetical protein